MIYLRSQPKPDEQESCGKPTQCDGDFSCLWGLMSELHQSRGVPVFLEEVEVTGRGHKKVIGTDQSAHLLPWEHGTNWSL